MSLPTSSFSRRELARALLVGALACLAQFGLPYLFGGSGSSIPWLYFLSHTTVWIPWLIVLAVGLRAIERPHSTLFFGTFLAGNFLLGQFAGFGVLVVFLGRALVLGLAARFSWSAQDKDAKYLFLGILPALGMQLLQTVLAPVLLIGPAWPLFVALALYSGLIVAGNLVWEGRGRLREESAVREDGIKNGTFRFVLIAGVSAALAYLMFGSFALWAPPILFLAMGWQRRPSPEKFLGLFLLCAWFGAVMGAASEALLMGYPPLLAQGGILIGLCLACVLAWGFDWKNTLLIFAGLVPGLALVSMVRLAPGRGTFDSQELGYAVIYGLPGYYLTILLPLWIADNLGAAVQKRGLRGGATR